MTPQEIQDLVLYRDGLMLVINKPRGYAVHPGRGKKPNMEDFFGHLRFGLPAAPNLAHRLDASTAGCLVLGRHPKALRRLGKLFAGTQIRKTYWAVVKGVLAQDEGVIDLPLAKKSDMKSHWWMKVDEAGVKAVTEYKVLGRSTDHTWVELRPLTGRTHQLRVHMEALGHPIVGDPVYGREVPDLDDDNLHLLARSITIPLYPKRDPITVIAPVPEHMRALLISLGLQGE